MFEEEEKMVKMAGVDGMSLSYKCNKCGDIAESKREIPLEHGKIGIVVYPQKNISTKCDGIYEPVITKSTTLCECGDQKGG